MFSEWACARLPDTVASEDVGRLSMRATVEITGESKCSDEGALRNARDVAGDGRENCTKGTCYMS